MNGRVRFYLAPGHRVWLYPFHMKLCLALSALGVTFAAVGTTTAHAQEPVPVTQPATVNGQATVTPTTTVTTQQTQTTQPRTTVVPLAVAGATDHDSVVGKFAVGFMGVSSVPIPTGTGGGAMTTQQVPAVTIGARYWMNEKLGIDAGLGLGWTGGGSEVQVGTTPTVNNDIATTFAFRVHAGVPYALAAGKHYTFLVIPEANIGYAGRTVKSPVPTVSDTDQNGFTLDLGARVGTEIQFGFIDIPQLSLQASVGAAFSYSRVKATTGGDYTRQSNTAFLTSLQAAPWALFTNSISAFYYFP